MIKEDTKRKVGAVIILSGIFMVLSSFAGITGATIGSGFFGSFGFFIGLALIIGGAWLVVAGREAEEGGLEKLSKSQKKAKRVIEQILKSGAVGDTERLKKLIRKMGYEIIDGGSHEIVCYPNGKKVISRSGHPVTIPRHYKDIKKPEYRGILKDLLYDLEQRYA